MADALAGVAQQRSAQVQVLGPGQQVALEDGVLRRRRDGRLQQVGVGVAEAVDPDAADEVDAAGAVGEPHPRAAPGAVPEGREEELAPALPLELAQGALVGVGREGALLGLLRDGGDQGAGCLAHRGGVEQARRAGWSDSWPWLTQFIGRRAARLALKFIK